ncbi:Glycerophosphoryl diester phosphodiesterase family protein [Dyadobacter soli]|uniref:Glycerophosphoryl diester phosphodiesterase family protein n=1 Tax=Dyadobacter soli TaxID=659014 RepID=A0A1G8AQ01_9BACT|nr:glycerophosphodiester phosphodiesterase family protein [Dyadobacter soli]SDH23065.1 Glycerophosphoryl diester phosphodiesterase family protein [Dyadobacter soli]
MKQLFSLIPAFVLIMYFTNVYGQGKAIGLIAHRGGVVDSTFTENGLPALKEAARQGYGMVETDMRVTADGVLIANHDADFNRFYGDMRKVTETNWAEATKLTSKLDGNHPMLLEDVLRFCAEKRMAVMLDNKIAGLDSTLFYKLTTMLDRYHLRETALMIGTDESTEFFTGKVRLSCSRKQLEDNIKKPGYRPEHYYLFERPANLTREDVAWARTHNIRVVAAINKFHYRKSTDMMADAQKDCERMLGYGITDFQIDSEFRIFLRK